MKSFKTIFFLSLIAVISTSCEDKETPLTEGFLEINGSQVYYKTMGEGEPLIILHGGPVLDHSYLLPHLEPLAEDFQLIFYDQRAAGQSSIDVDPKTMTLDGFIEDIEQVRQQLNLGRINLLGHSWGGMLAMNYAIKYDQNLNHLILSNASAPSVLDAQQEGLLVAQKMTKRDQDKLNNLTSSGLLRTEDPSDAINEMMMISYRVHMYDTANMDRLVLSIPKDFMLRSQAYRTLNPDLANYDLYDQLPQVSTPTLVIFGESEPAVQLHANRMAGAFQNGELLVVKGTGHFPFIEAREKFVSTVKSFLSN